jgi:hypothetical protein
MRDYRYKRDELYWHVVSVIVFFKMGTAYRKSTMFCVYKKLEERGLSLEFFNDGIYAGCGSWEVLTYKRSKVTKRDFETYLEIKSHVQQYDFEQKLQAELAYATKKTTRKVKI